MLTVVTTCSASGWDLYGRRMVASWLRHWSREAQLILYAEGFEPALHDDRLEVRALPAWHVEFKKRHAANPSAHGMVRGEYSFRRDAVRFSHKVAALTDVRQTDGLLVWADADTVTSRPVDEGWLRSLLPDDRDWWIAWLDREYKYPECGFMIFRCAHASHYAMMCRIRETYEEDSVFSYEQTHDSYVIQQIVEGAASEGVVPAPVSLSGRRRTGHPFASGPLGTRMEHLKGRRKERWRGAA